MGESDGEEAVRQDVVTQEIVDDYDPDDIIPPIGNLPTYSEEVANNDLEQPDPDSESDTEQLPVDLEYERKRTGKTTKNHASDTCAKIDKNSPDIAVSLFKNFEFFQPFDGFLRGYFLVFSVSV